jgi:hypothetical protein
MLAVFEVELVGGEGFLAGLGGPALIAGAAVVAAFIAARTANARLREQLAHDLVVRRAEHVRDALDAAVELAHETVKALVDFELIIDDWEDERPQFEAEALSDEKTTEEQRAILAQARKGVDNVMAADKALTERMVEMLATTTRLRLRLGSSHAIPTLYDELRQGWRELIDVLGNGETARRTKEERDKCEELDAETNQLYEEFHQACERWLDEDPTFA